MGNVQSPILDEYRYKGKKYEPSQQQVDDLYEELTGYLERWIGVDVELLIMKLASKIREKHPSIFLPPSDMQQGGGEGGEPTANAMSLIKKTARNNKKRKVEAGPIIIHGIRVPKEVVGRILPYCDRSSTNNFSLTCTGAFHVIHRDRRVVKGVPWPSHRPWPIRRFDPRMSRDRKIIASVDMSRFAICDFLGGYQYIQVWDRSRGLIGELRWRIACRYPPVVPVFSPDSQLLLTPLSVKDDGSRYWRIRGVQVVQLPLGGSAVNGPIVVSQHQLHGGTIHAVSFVNNDTIAVVETHTPHDGGKDGISLWNVNRSECSISLSFSHVILSVTHPILEELEDQTHSYWKITSWICGNKKFLAIRSSNETGRIIFHDLTSNESVSINTPGGGRIQDLVFSQNGTLVVTFRSGNRGWLCLFDCDVNVLGEIDEPRVICASELGWHESIFSFSADGTKVATAFVGPSLHNYQIIDLQEGEVLYSENRYAIWDHQAWINFVNSTVSCS